MPTTTSVQSRIAAFENGKPFRSTSPSPSPPNLGRRTSLIDLKDWVVDDGDGPTNPPLINLAPPLPPRKPTFLYPPTRSSHAPRSSVSSFHSVSLSSDTDPDSMSNFIATFPMDSDVVSLSESYEVLRPSPATERSFSNDWENSVARTPPKLPQRPSPRSPPPRPPPLANSQPSSPSVRSPTSALPLPTNAYAVRRPAPPPPPSRSSDRASITSASSHSHSSHSHSTTTPNTPGRLRRPTPVPPAARKRYDAVFIANILQVRRAEREKSKEKPPLLSPGHPSGRGRRAAGWRGLSVDLITAGPPLDVNTGTSDKEDDDDPLINPAARLDGQAVGCIWARSRLDKARLREIWAECDTSHQGSLDIDAFAKGMWRIDEELRRTQALAIKSASTASLGSLRSKLGRAAYRPQKQRDLLR